MDANSKPRPVTSSRSSSKSLSPETGPDEGATTKGQVLVFSLSNRPKQSRASAPKSRNGCRECRRRHIKCDQARPYCMKCTKSGRECDGYLDSASRATPAKQSTVARRNIRMLPATDTRMFKMLDYETMLFGGQKDWEAFQTFVYSIECGDTLAIDNTSMMIPQFAQSAAATSAVRQVCCGIGTLSRCFELISQEDINTEEYRHALEHYGRGIRAIFNAKPTTSTFPGTIMASLAFGTFECISGNIEATIKHQNHSVAMMGQYIDLLIEDQGVPLDRLTLSDVEQGMFDTLERLDTNPWVLGFEKGNQIKVTSVSRRFPHGCRHRLHMKNMPERFNGTQQAFTWWHFMQHTMMHTLHPLKTSNATESQKTAAYEECAHLLGSWHSSFMPLFVQAKQQRHIHSSRWSRAIILESLYVETLSALHSRHKKDSNVLPAVKSIYWDLLHMSAQLLREKPLNGMETAGRENCIIRPILFVLLKCHDADIVQEAKSVLESAVGGIGLSWPLLCSLNSPKRTKPLLFCDRAWGWYLTNVGCSSGAHVFDDIP